LSRTITRTVGDLTDPDFRRERASKAGRASHSVDSHVRAIAARAAELTPQHTAILRPLLPPVPAEPDADGRGESS
jgi:hypothetical protein